jgi:hypothetical protein
MLENEKTVKLGPSSISVSMSMSTSVSTSVSPPKNMMVVEIRKTIVAGIAIHHNVCVNIEVPIANS